MANFDLAKQAKAQLKLVNKFQSNELRFRSPEVYKLYLRNTEFMTPDYRLVKTSTDRVIDLNYFTRTSRALGSAYSHNHTGAQGDSGVLTPTWTSHTDKFASTLKEANNKIYTWDELHASKLENVIANFAEGLETVAHDHLFANRSGVNLATANGTFDATDDVFKITESTHVDQAIQITKVAMDANKYQGVRFDIVCDSVSFMLFEKQAAQGISNATNLSFQYNNVTFILDPKMDADAAGLVGAYTKGFWIAVPEGSIGSLPWIPIQNREGYEGPDNVYGNIVNPIDGTMYATHTYEERANGTSLGGQRQDVKMETEIFIEQALVVAPLSTANETPLQAFALV